MNKTRIPSSQQVSSFLRVSDAELFFLGAILLACIFLGCLLCFLIQLRAKLRRRSDEEEKKFFEKNEILLDTVRVQRPNSRLVQELPKLKSIKPRTSFPQSMYMLSTYSATRRSNAESKKLMEENLHASDFVSMELNKSQVAAKPKSKDTNESLTEPVYQGHRLKKVAQPSMKYLNRLQTEGDGSIFRPSDKYIRTSLRLKNLDVKCKPGTMPSDFDDQDSAISSIV